MLTKPDTTTLHSMDRLRCSQEWTILRTYLAGELDSAKDALVMSNDAQIMARLQGRAKVLQDFMVLVDDAGAVLERMRSQPQQNRQA